MGENNAESITNELFYHYAANFTPQTISIEQLRSFNGLQDVSDSDALNIIDGLYQLSIVTYKIHCKGL